MRPANHNNLYIVTHQFNHNALRVARELRGIQKNKLAKNLELTPSAITQFESGKSRPNAQTVGRISLALNFPPSFFYLASSLLRPGPFSQSQIIFADRTTENGQYKCPHRSDY